MARRRNDAAVEFHATNLELKLPKMLSKQDSKSQLCGFSLDLLFRLEGNALLVTGIFSEI